MEFKYAEEHSLLSCDCPPKDELKQEDITGYRWVHEDLSHPNNTLPPNKTDLNRVKKAEPCHMKCENYALSFFKSASKAENRLKKLIEGRPLFVERAGNSIAECELKASDGMISKPSRNSGHFNLHEFKDVNLQSRFKFLKKVII